MCLFNDPIIKEVFFSYKPKIKLHIRADRSLFFGDTKISNLYWIQKALDQDPALGL